MIEKEDLNEDLESESHTDDSLIPISGMYKDWFIDYASYVCLLYTSPSPRD